MVKKKKPSAFTVDSHLKCEQCNVDVHVGTGGYRNLELHIASKACKDRHKAAAKPEKKSKSLLSFFGSQKPTKPVVPRVKSPPLVHADAITPIDTPGQIPPLLSPQEIQSRHLTQPIVPIGNELASQECPHALGILRRLQEKLASIPNETALAGPDHPLAVFSEHPVECANRAGRPEDDWEEILNPKMKCAFGWGCDSTEGGFARRGPNSLDGFIRFIEYFITQRSLEGSLVETKINVLLEAIEKEFLSLEVATERPDTDIIDVDSPAGLANLKAKTQKTATSDALSPVKATPCIGIHLVFPPGKDHHTSYPFGLHSSRIIPWNYHSIEDRFYLQSNCCSRVVHAASDDRQYRACRSCEKIRSDDQFQSIYERIKFGVHINTPVEYQPIGGLVHIVRKKTEQLEEMHLTKLNDNRTLARQAVSLADHKQWILAVASGRVDRVASLVQACLKRKMGIQGLLAQYICAADKLYRPKGYTHEDIQCSLVLLRLSGSRVAEFAHRSLSLPSPTTARRNALVSPLRLSVQKPTLAEVEENIKSFLGALAEFESDMATEHQGSKIKHQIFVLDEFAIEKRPRWDDRSNMFIGVCREHGGRVPLEFISEKELDIFCDALDNGTIHAACESSQATVGAFCTLSENAREAGVRINVISGTCKKETGPEHAALIRTVLEAGKKHCEFNGAIYRTVSIASDGESKRGDALVEITMRWNLRSESPIYKHLKPLTFLNLLVGEDDITADKDFKHIFKRQRNLMLRNKGFTIEGFCITPSILHVVLGYRLLKEIWSLPSAPIHGDPMFLRARKALGLYGEFARHLILPYICVDLNLDEQLIHLSTAAHLAFYFYTDNGARTDFMPSQSFVDIMIMIKNAYFCVAKSKVDLPDGKFFLIMLGTDKLEGFFGLIRTAVGTDCNADLLQLGSRASGLTEVAVILSLHPEWDRSPRRLNLPAMTKDTDELTSKVDHINAVSWRGDVHVKNVNLQTSWVLGREKAIELLPNARQVFETAETDESIDFLSPFGQILVNQRDEDEAYNCSDLLADYPPDMDENPATDNDRETTVSHVHTTLDGDLEDAIAHELLRGPISSEILIGGKTMGKPAALRSRLQHRLNRASTDRLRRVEEVPCFNSSGDESFSENLIVSSSEFGLPCIRVGHPAAALVRCEEKIFLAIVNIIALRLADIDKPELELRYLGDKTAKVDVQVLRLIPTTEDIDPTGEHDWCWLQQMEMVCKNVPGRLVCAIDTTMIIQQPGKTSYLFVSLSLLALAESIYWRLSTNEILCIPTVKRTPFFPYRLRGKACFLVDGKPMDSTINDGYPCSKCGPRTGVDRSNGQRMLEHMGAHILHDPSIPNNLEVCGLCLRPAPMCTIYLKKGRGGSKGYSVDMNRSTCINLIRFRYASAATSTESAPCTNVPIHCPICGPKQPAVWRYSLYAHFHMKHDLASADFPIQIQRPTSETNGLEEIWKKRFQIPKKRVFKNRKILPLIISTAHSVGLSENLDFNPENEEEEDLSDVNGSLNDESSDCDEEDEDGQEEDMDCEVIDMRGKEIETAPESVENVELEIASTKDTHLQTFSVTNTQEAPTANNEDTDNPTTNIEADREEPEPAVEPEVGIGARRSSGRVRKRTEVDSQCECDTLITLEEKEAGVQVMECKARGCETGWFHMSCMDFEFIPKNWTCPSCKPGTTKRRRVGA
ncbi:hypothetical protein GALMADRAFT_139524 [Galerina marginata CBS 339.88]|uniref:Zinc finger PHD-type domain-containing protein n=1 Tax=Galerina marginata (strain CBS 339.88) TaxID=685588 RepID=A0A067T093_GALM3|nr:hypothetical protein GALMADRAFT_139524 [Galerina marginata CBS 339.88]